MTQSSDSCSFSTVSLSLSERKQICINPYWTDEEGDADVNPFETDKGFATVFRANQAIVVRTPEASLSSVVIKQGSDHVETLKSDLLFRITPTETETVVLEIIVFGGFVSLLLVDHDKVRYTT